MTPLMLYDIMLALKKSDLARFTWLGNLAHVDAFYYRDNFRNQLMMISVRSNYEAAMQVLEYSGFDITPWTVEKSKLVS